MLSIRANDISTFPLHRQVRLAALSLERLSSGQRLNRASDDAAGLSMAETMRAQVRGSAQAARNIQDGISFTQIAEDGVQGILPIIHRMRELTVQAGNGTHSTANLASIDTELTELKNAINDASMLAKGLRMKYTDPMGPRIVDYQIGANVNEILSVNYDGLALVLGTFVAAFPVLNTGNVNGSLGILDTAISGLTGQLAYLGAMHNSLAHALNNVTNYAGNMAAAESRIRDTDMAAESSNFLKSQLMVRSAIAMQGQGNVKRQALARLFRAAEPDATVVAPYMAPVSSRQ